MREWLSKVRHEGLAPAFMVKFHLFATVVFLVLIPPSMILWAESVPYLVAISVWANFAGHLSAWQAARVEVKQDEQQGEPDLGAE